MKKINNIFNHISLGFLLFFILYSTDYVVVMAQSSTEETKGEIRSQKFDTRSLSLGNATIADLYGGLGIGINAAVSGLSEKGSLLRSDSYHDWNTNLMQHNLTLPTVHFNAHKLIMRLGFLHNGLNEINPSATPSAPEPDLNNYEADLAYALAITDDFSMGLLQQVSYLDNNEEQFVIYNADISLIYAPDGPISYGMAFRGIGREGNYDIIPSGETIIFTSSKKSAFEIGATYHYTVDDRYFFSLSLANEKRFGEDEDDEIWYKAGLELSPIPFLALRGGILFQIDNDIFLPRAGVGLVTGFLNIDYAIAPDNFSGEQFHQLGLTIKF